MKTAILDEFRQSYIGPAILKYGNMMRAADCPMDPLMKGELRPMRPDLNYPIMYAYGEGEQVVAVYDPQQVVEIDRARGRRSFAHGRRRRELGSGHGRERPSDTWLSVSSAGGTSQRQSVRVFVAPGAHVLRWSAPEAFAYGPEGTRIRLAVENVRLERPIANRETLFDCGRLVYDLRIWKPDNLGAIQDGYTKRIEANPSETTRPASGAR